MKVYVLIEGSWAEGTHVKNIYRNKEKAIADMKKYMEEMLEEWPQSEWENPSDTVYMNIEAYYKLTEETIIE